MSLPRIPSAEPVTTEAVEARTYPDWYMTGLTIHAQPAGDLKAAVHMRPYDYDSGEAGPAENGVRIEVDDLRSTAERRASEGNPALQQALGAVLAAVAELITDGAVLALRRGNVIEIKEYAE